MTRRPQPWYQDGLRFACTRCGACCKGEGFVWVDEREVSELADSMRLSVDDFGRRFLRQVGSRLALIDGPDGACIFWDDGCRVYPARPTQCRTFPFWRQNLVTEGSWQQVAQESPGVGRGKLYSLAEIEQLVAGIGETGSRDGKRSER